MSTIISLLTGPGGLYAVLFSAIGVALLWARRSGAKSVENKQARAEAKARDIADEVENDVGALTPEQRKERLKQWSGS